MTTDYSQPARGQLSDALAILDDRKRRETEPTFDASVKRAAPRARIVEVPVCEGAITAMKMVEVLDARVAALEAKPAKKPYDFLKFEEALWAIATAVGAVLLQALENPENIKDIRTYAIAAGIAAIRAGIGAAMSLKKKDQPAVPTPHGEGS
jgi:hypothetical protein